MKQPEILVLRGGAIGDFICTLPALAALRRRWPHARIELLGYPHVACLAQEAELVDSVRSLDQAGIAQYFSLKPRISEIDAEWIRTFDIIITYLFDPLETVRTNLLAIGAKQVIYCSPRIEERHAVDQLFRALEELAIFPEGTEVARLNVSAQRLREGRRRLQAYGPRVVAIHPGSGSPRKNWPLDRFLGLAEDLRLTGVGTPVFLAGEADEKIVSELTSGRGGDIPLIRGVDLPTLAGILSACVGYVGNDSGITHLAAASGIPVVALFGPTSAALWGPRGSNVCIIAAEGLERDNIASIPPQRVLEAAKKLTDRAARSYPDSSFFT